MRRSFELLRRVARGLAAGSLLVAGCAAPPLDLDEVEQRLDRLERGVETVHRANWARQWESLLWGASPEAGAVPGALLAYYELDSLAEWRGRLGDEELERRVALLYRHCLRAQVDSDPLIAALASPLVERRRGRVRRLGGIKTNDAVLAFVARSSPRRERREEAWRLLRAGDATATDDLAALLRRRNAVAREAGFDDFYHLYLAMEDLDETEVDRLLGDLEGRSQEAALAAAERAARSLGVDRVRPWDREVDLHPFLNVLEPRLTRERLHRSLADTVTDLGLGDALQGVRVGTPYVGFGARTYAAFPVDPPEDVRIMVSEGAGFYAFRGAFHETGHAIYYRGAVQQRLVDRLPPNGPLSEGFAKVFERLPYQPQWWRTYLDATDEVAALVRPFSRADELHRVRFFLASHRFERAAYADPDQDLDALYRQVMEEITFADRQGCGASWTAVPHYVTQPFASLEYLHARLIQAQVYRTLRERFDGIIGRPEVGPLLLEGLAAPGSSSPWRDVVRGVTGSDLAVDAYLEDELGLGRESVSP